MRPDRRPDAAAGEGGIGMASNKRRVLITGTGQGIGLEWARQEALDGSIVIATARDPKASPALLDLEKSSRGGIVVLPLDVTDDASVEAAARAVQERFGAIDELVNNAGTYGPRDDRRLGAPPEEVSRVLEVNAVGPYRVTRRFLPLLRQGKEVRVVFITSLMGSIGDGPGGGSYGYRMSKSALNMLGANLAHDLAEDRIVCLILHPGWVKTRMGGAQAPLPIEPTVRDLRRTTMRSAMAESGTFLDHTGEPLPW
jgi:NAD(P)-dependent dehydrogenase (short-subunit alcohol dehydrogenase family)